MHECIHRCIERQTSLMVKYVDTWMMRRENSHSSFSCTQTFPTGVVQGSERLPVITTAIDQSDQRKLEVDWPGCFTEEWGCVSDFLTLPPIIIFSLSCAPSLFLCYSPIFITLSFHLK